MNIRHMKTLLLLATIVGITGCGDSASQGTGGTGGTGGSGSSCETVATSPGTWDIQLEFAVGDPLPLTGFTVVQSGCMVTMSLSDPVAGTVTIVGPLSDTGVWTAALSAPGASYSANFSGTFSGSPPYTMITIMSGTDSDGDTITGGFGEITP
jgi:hypothetical protein